MRLATVCCDACNDPAAIYGLCLSGDVQLLCYEHYCSKEQDLKYTSLIEAIEAIGEIMIGNLDIQPAIEFVQINSEQVALQLLMSDCVDFAPAVSKVFDSYLTQICHKNTASEPSNFLYESILPPEQEEETQFSSFDNWVLFLRRMITYITFGGLFTLIRNKYPAARQMKIDESVFDLPPEARRIDTPVGEAISKVHADIWYREEDY